jgi:hypothetical protein
MGQRLFVTVLKNDAFRLTNRHNLEERQETLAHGNRWWTVERAAFWSKLCSALPLKVELPAFCSFIFRVLVNGRGPGLRHIVSMAHSMDRCLKINVS